MTSDVDKPVHNAAQPTSQTPESRHPLAGLRSEIDRLFDVEPLRRLESAFTGAVPPSPPAAVV